MKMMSSIGALALCAALAACSSVPKTAPTATAAPVSSTGVAAVAAPKLICETTHDMGSHMQHRECLTPEQVAQRHKDSQQAAQDLQNRAQQLNSEGKPPA